MHTMRNSITTAALRVLLLFGPTATADLAFADEQITFNKHIAPLVFERCAGCHHPGEVAPFSLLSYSDVKKRDKQIAQVTADKFMPPWKSVEGHGRFLGERRLTAEQIALIGRWVEQGSAEGNRQDLPAAPRFDTGWQLGQPDIVLTMDEPYAIAADGDDIYRNFILKLELPAGKYIKALEYRPNNRRIVHHAVFSSDPTDKSRQADQADPGPGWKGSLNIPGRLFPGSLAAWAPGREPMPLPDGLSMPWKNGTDLVMQLHLHPSGKPEEEQSSVGFFLTDEPPRRSMADVGMIAKGIDIPAGERNYPTRDEFTVPVEMEVLGIFPHMHMIGRDIKLVAHPPEGAAFNLLWIDDWDFNWQSLYQCDPPVKLPAGTKVMLEGVHDNSADNFRNPNHPPKRVTAGEQTTDEMSAALLQLVPVRESDLAKMLEANKRRVVSGITAQPSANKPAAP
jgi:hypothetical protein